MYILRFFLPLPDGKSQVEYMRGSTNKNHLLVSSAMTASEMYFYTPFKRP